MTADAHIRTEVLMGTFVTMQVIDHETNPERARDRAAAVERAFEWFRRIETGCSRFLPDSELMQLTSQIGVAVPASEMLFEAVQFALAVADESGGAFDPTVGYSMETRGFNREHRSGRTVQTNLVGRTNDVSYRDVVLDPARRTITLRRPLVLDLGAVAKGLAVDMAARELQPFTDFAIDAGGDVYLGGHNTEGAPWRVGIRHPRLEHDLIDAVHVSDRAVCTSGDYERRTGDDDSGHHIMDPRTGASVTAVASVTVIAPTAMAADALATAGFVLGPVDGIRLFERQGVEGLILSTSLQRYATQGMCRDSILQDAEGPVPHHSGHSGRAGGSA